MVFNMFMNCGKIFFPFLTTSDFQHSLHAKIIQYFTFYVKKLNKLNQKTYLLCQTKENKLESRDMPTYCQLSESNFIWLNTQKSQLFITSEANCLDVSVRYKGLNNLTFLIKYIVFFQSGHGNNNYRRNYFSNYVERHLTKLSKIHIRRNRHFHNFNYLAFPLEDCKTRI